MAERPLTLDADALGDALALGVTPVRRPVRAAVHAAAGTRDRASARGRPGRLRGHRAGRHPRIRGGASEEDYDDLRQIAPTVMTEGDDWKLNLRLHGEALGRTNDAERLLVDWDNRVAKVRAAIARARGVDRALREGRRVREFSLEPGTIGGSILSDLGIRAGRRRRRRPAGRRRSGMGRRRRARRPSRARGRRAALSRSSRFLAPLWERPLLADGDWGKHEHADP